MEIMRASHCPPNFERIHSLDVKRNLTAARKYITGCIVHIYLPRMYEIV